MDYEKENRRGKTGQEERKVQEESPNITKTRKVLKWCGKTRGGRKCVGCSRHTYVTVSQPAQKRQQPDQSGPSRVCDLYNGQVQVGVDCANALRALELAREVGQVVKRK